MVVFYESEKPNLSYVRINQNTSDGTGPSIKTYITKGLVASDPFVVNASLLHPSLVAQPTVLTIVETPFWGDLELPNEHQDGTKEASKTGEAVASDNRVVTASPSPPATPRAVSPEVPSTSPAAPDQPLTSVRLPEGAILVKINSSQPPSYPTPPSSPPHSTTPVTVSIKRKLDEKDQANSPKVAKIATPQRKLIVLKGRPDLIQENQRLERNNKILADENRELREKLDLLSKILKDPRKRDMLNARLERMQTAAC